MRKLFLVIATALVPLSAQASPVPSALPGAELRGAATFRFVGFPLYEAQLFTRSAAPLDWSEDFALELKYLRNLTENDLVEGTLRELARTGAPLPVRDQLQRCFKDVNKGDRYLAVSKGQNQIGFWLNGKRVCTLGHPQIKARFMEIFLGDNTRSQSFTRKLKGE
ncbi:hypothetical protein [Aliiroseovarius subalbicans]|uniref:hypothetical protein n=1 Tax=Aliiroseovarius subalbicans TaxID=2925840 RepID=UPI001F579941|nr:hypothetical protein [Aliiroseovarius subalbicans]MCI2398953.1 hypothetical protein [Aliiroseovarius subalbicans]